MKIRKILGVFTAAALMAVAALPFSASAAENYVSLIVLEEAMVNNTDETEDNCQFEYNDGAWKITVGSKQDIGKAECYAMADGGLPVFEFDFEAMPNLYYDVSGDAKWDLLIRCNNLLDTAGNSGLIKLSEILGQNDGVSAGKGSVNLYEAVNNNDDLVLSTANDTTIRVVKYVVYGDPGDSVTINSLYLANEEQSNVSVNAGSSSNASSTASTNSTSKAPTSSSQVSTGESLMPIIGITALAVVASSAVIVSAKKRK